MIKGIIKTIIVVLIFLGLLWLGGYSFSSFQHSIDLKNPGDVYEPLVDELPDLPNVDVPDLPEVEDPLVSNNDDNSEIASDTDVDIPNINDYPTELEPTDINLPQYRIIVNKTRFRANSFVYQKASNQQSPRNTITSASDTLKQILIMIIKWW